VSERVYLDVAIGGAPAGRIEVDALADLEMTFRVRIWVS
jgi:hypothetical protein